VLVAPVHRSPSGLRNVRKTTEALPELYANRGGYFNYSNLAWP